MANCRFIRYTSNKARRTPTSTTYPRIINGLTGTYSGCAARLEDPAFPMDNVLQAGRKGNVWVVPDGAGSNFPDGTSVVLEIDIGSLQNISAVGALAFNTGGSAFPSNVYIDAIPGTTTYNNAAYAAQNASNPITTPGTRDNGALLAAPVSARYWRFRFGFATSGIGFSVASVVLSNLLIDLGFLYSSADEQRVRPRSIVEGFDQSPVLTFVGPEYVRWAMEFNNNDAALRTTLDSLYGDTQPFIFITPDNEWQECVWATEEFSREHIWGMPNRYRMTVELRQLS
jgi:hypothetical protein